MFCVWRDVVRGKQKIDAKFSATSRGLVINVRCTDHPVPSHIRTQTDTRTTKIGGDSTVEELEGEARCSFLTNLWIVVLIQNLGRRCSVVCQAKN